MANEKQEQIRKIIEQFEHGLSLAGINSDNIDYDILAGVRVKCWNDLENLISN